MSTNSLVQKFDFTVADLISPQGSNLSLLNSATQYYISDRLYNALRAEAAESKRLVSNLFLQLQDEVLAGLERDNGPVATALGFTASDFISKDVLSMSFAKDKNMYAISQRLKDAIKELAYARDVRCSTVFFELQAELTCPAEVAA